MPESGKILENNTKSIVISYKAIIWSSPRLVHWEARQGAGAPRMGAEHHAADRGGPDRGRGEAGRAHVSWHQLSANECLMFPSFV